MQRGKFGEGRMRGSRGGKSEVVWRMQRCQVQRGISENVFPGLITERNSGGSRTDCGYTYKVVFPLSYVILVIALVPHDGQSTGVGPMEIEWRGVAIWYCCCWGWPMGCCCCCCCMDCWEGCCCCIFMCGCCIWGCGDVWPCGG